MTAPPPSPRGHRLATLAMGLAGAALALGGCGSSAPSATDDTPASSASSSSSPAASPPTSPPTSEPSSASPPATSTAAAAALIVIKDFAYAGTTTVAPGTTVKVRNDDAEAHTVTTDSGSAFDVTIPPGQTARFKAPARSGAYAYHCTFHANMKGTLTVS